MCMIKPKFYTKIPKDAMFFFYSASDDDFKAEHPVAYIFLVVCSIAALMLPVILYAVFVTEINPALSSAWMALGWIGAFLIGTGFFNIVAAWIGQYLGHIVTGLCIGVGALMVGVSLLLIYG